MLMRPSAHVQPGPVRAIRMTQMLPVPPVNVPPNLALMRHGDGRRTHSECGHGRDDANEGHGSLRPDARQSRSLPPRVRGSRPGRGGCRRASRRAPDTRQGHFQAGRRPGSSSNGRRVSTIESRFRPGPGRFIPARAGNTRRGVGSLCAGPVHPRSRGEHVKVVDQVKEIVGSSPLARGTLRRVVLDARVDRFIPARAGNTVRRSRRSNPTAVHPRSRGEHTAHTCAAWMISGSSPLARGTRMGGLPPDTCNRFIPARAGNTSCRCKTTYR